MNTENEVWDKEAYPVSILKNYICSEYSTAEVMGLILKPLFPCNELLLLLAHLTAALSPSL